MAIITNKISKVNIWTGSEILTYEIGVNCDKINLNYLGQGIYSAAIFQKTGNPWGLEPIDIYDRAWAVWR